MTNSIDDTPELLRNLAKTINLNEEPLTTNMVVYRWLNNKADEIERAQTEGSLHRSENSCIGGSCPIK